MYCLKCLKRKNSSRAPGQLDLRPHFKHASSMHARPLPPIRRLLTSTLLPANKNIQTSRLQTPIRNKRSWWTQPQLPSGRSDVHQGPSELPSPHSPAPTRRTQRWAVRAAISANRPDLREARETVVDRVRQGDRRRDARGRLFGYRWTFLWDSLWFEILAKLGSWLRR